QQPDEQEQDSLKYRKKQPQYAKEDETPTGKKDRGVFEFGFRSHIAGNESLTDEEVMRDP
ncbi:MAG TPA: hypothetical protein VN743_14325, partial [Blastocatellia bacterium]|nr:hypothetical protein [Blastocatellia bacterium]